MYAKWVLTKAGGCGGLVEGRPREAATCDRRMSGFQVCRTSPREKNTHVGISIS